MVNTIKFSQFTNAGDLLPGQSVVGVNDGNNAIYNNQYGFLPAGSTADRPSPGANVNWMQRLNTDTGHFEFYNPTLSEWVVITDSSS